MMEGEQKVRRVVPPKRRDAFTSTAQDRSTYLTTAQLARELHLWPEQVYRWCVSWFGGLPENRKGKGMGYRIPLHYRYVARAWLQTQDPELREQVRAAIDDDPKNFVLVVGNHTSTHYSVAEVQERMTQVLPLTERDNVVLHVIHVGPIES